VPRDAALATIDREAVAARPAAEAMFAGLLALERIAVAEHHFNLLRWLIGLPSDLDPAAAARSILDYQRTHPRPALSSALSDLLAVVGRCSRERLDELSRNRRSFRTAARSD
jgi:hypothetical protein